MALTYTEVLDNMYTSTWQNMKSESVDNIFDSTPFFFFLRDKGKMKPVSGGRYITEPLQYAKNENVKWVKRGGKVSLSDYQFLTTAKFDWKYQTASMVRFGVDDQQNRGKAAIMSMMNTKVENTKNSLGDDLETTLAAGAASDEEFDGLQLLVPDDPTASVSVGGIAQDIYTWWQSKTKNMTGISFASLGEYWMRNMLNNVSNNLNMDRPDILLGGQTPFEYYEDSQMEYVRLVNNKIADAGFDVVQFKGIPFIWSPSIANTRIYFLNTKFINFVYDPVMFFDMTEWKAIPDQVRDRAAQIVTACALTVSRRRCLGVMHTIDTA